MEGVGGGEEKGKQRKSVKLSQYHTMDYLYTSNVTLLVEACLHVDLHHACKLAELMSMGSYHILILSKNSLF